MLYQSILSALLLFTLNVDADKVVDTEYGKVRGYTIPVTVQGRQNRITSFYGIPFAKPPVGALRFEPPQKHDGWGDEEFDADRLPDQCMQNPLGLLVLTHPLWIRYSEDCLTLNVFVPETVVTPLPVFVWFHGGGYTGGGSIQYPGHFMAARDTIVVVVNYRLGIFGFASTPDKQIRGNMGMLDQVMALEWVRDNIANFGGLPNRVTIYGQSAGASSSALHMVSPRSRGLYYQAILESGSENNLWTLNYPGQKPDEYIFQVAPRLNCTTDDITEMLRCMRQVSARDLRINDWLECTDGYFCQGFAPIVDGEGGFMPEMPLKLREELGSNSVPIISGITRNDGSLYTIYFIPEALDGGFTREEFQYYMRERLVSIFAAQARNDEILENANQAFDWKYTPWPYINDLDANREAINEMITDGAFGYPWDRNAKFNSFFADTYTYIMSFRGVNGSSLIPEWMGLPHSGELAYVWAYSYLTENPAVRNDSGIYFDIVGWTPEDNIYSDYVQTLWSNFAKYGNPTPTPVKAPFNDTMTTWPLYDWNDNLKLLYLDAEISVKELWRQPDYSFFTDYMSYVIEIPILADKKPISKRKPYRFNTLQIQNQISRMAKEFIEQQFPGESEEIIDTLMNL